MKSVSERKEMVEPAYSALSISAQCVLLGLWRSGIYYMPSSEREENLLIMRILDEQYLKTPFYGVERLREFLLRKDYKVNRKRLRRLMRLIDWRTIYPEKHTTIADATKYKYPYLLRHLKIDRPNQIWAVDITYIPMRRGFMYLFAIIDLHTRYVVGWRLSNSMTAEWCVETIGNAVSRFGKPEIVNSDQGSQFTSDLWVNFLKENDIQISMDGKGRAIDNVFIERLWRSVKYEHVYLHAAQDGKELWQGLDKYFWFYNNERLHQSLGYKPPRSLYTPAI